MPPDALLSSSEANDLALFLRISGMHLERAGEIGILDTQRLLFRPLIKAHLLDQAKIEKLGVVWSDSCSVRVGVKDDRMENQCTHSSM